MLTWPHRHGDWAPRLKQVEPVFVQLAHAIGRREKVLIVAYDDAHRSHIASLLQAAGVAAATVDLRVASSNDTWARDHGPITIRLNGRPHLLDFRFNGWGGKYSAELDNAITRQLHTAGAFGRIPLEDIDLVLEGGSVDTDGQGSLLTTSRCLLAPTRNPGLTREALESRLKALLGIERVLWLEHGYLAGDDTDSHIDTLARFCDAQTIAYVHCPDRQDEHYAELQHMEQELQRLRRPDGMPYRLVPLPWPQPRYDEHGRRLPATYANFLIINDAVLVPTYDDPADRVALERLQACFPAREIVDIPSLPLILQYGSLHCVTMQLPAEVLP